MSTTTTTTGTRYPDLFAALAAPFEATEVKARSQSGRQLHYVTARTVMNRLDAVVGPENWWDEFDRHEHSTLCRITVRLPDGSTLSKCDAGGPAGMPDAGDDDKSEVSDAFKRAAVKFGVGRYLYNDGVPAFVRERAAVAAVPDATEAPGPAPRDLGWVHADAPPLATPSHAMAPQKFGQPAAGPVANGRSRDDGPPRTGKAFFGWLKDQEQRHEVRILKYVDQWGKLQGYPSRLVDWDDDQVALGHAEACRELGSIRAAG